MIRKIGNDDYAEVSAFIHHVLRQETDDHFRKEGAAGVLSFLQEKLSSFLIKGLYDPQLKAVIVYEEEPFHIILLMVKKEDQHHGYGTSLLRNVLNEMEKKDIGAVIVHALAGAVGFYSANGFEADGPAEETDGLRYVTMEYLLGKKILGKKVHVIIDHPLGSLHPFIPDQIYPINTGYIEYADNLIETYVIGTNEPVETFDGFVRAVIYRHNDSARIVACPAALQLTKKQVIDAVAFQEQYYDTRIVIDGQEEK